MIKSPFDFKYALLFMVSGYSQTIGSDDVDQLRRKLAGLEASHGGESFHYAITKMVSVGVGSKKCVDLIRGEKHV